MTSNRGQAQSGGTKSRAKGKGSWYHITWRECVLCGQSEETRERQRGRKPKDPRKRYEYIETACWSHFL